MEIISPTLQVTEQTSYKPLHCIHISKAVDTCTNYIQARHAGKFSSLKTRWRKFNNSCMGGIEPNTILTIAGISGSGKSSFANMLENDLIDLNPSQDLIVLSFNFEMLSFRQIGRKLSNKLKKSTTLLYSGKDDEKLTESEIKQVNDTAETLKSYPVYYCDSPGTVQDIKATIAYFQQTIAKGK